MSAAMSSLSAICASAISAELDLDREFDDVQVEVTDDLVIRALTINGEPATADDWQALEWSGLVKVETAAFPPARRVA